MVAVAFNGLLRRVAMRERLRLFDVCEIGIAINPVIENKKSLRLANRNESVVVGHRLYFVADEVKRPIPESFTAFCIR